jgi:hypothetical protein
VRALLVQVVPQHDVKDPDLSWFNQSCLYGHKDNLKKILVKFKDNIDVNRACIEGNTSLHLAIRGRVSIFIDFFFSKNSIKNLNFSKKIEAKTSYLRVVQVVVLRLKGTKKSTIMTIVT